MRETRCLYADIMFRERIENVMKPNPKNFDLLHEIYDQETQAQIQSKATNGNGLMILYQILTSDNGFRIIQRKNLDKWLLFAKNKNGLDNDKLSRLKRPKSFHLWQSVVNEIEVAYFFAHQFNHNISFVTNASTKGEGEFVINTDNEKIIVEVKTPYDLTRSYTQSITGVHYGLDTHLIEKSFLQAAGQLKKGNVNLVIICTQLCDWIRGMPDSFLHYLFGPKEDHSKSDPCGEFVKHKKKRYTRISAIASFDDQLPESSKMSIQSLSQ